MATLEITTQSYFSIEKSNFGVNIHSSFMEQIVFHMSLEQYVCDGHLLLKSTFIEK